MGFPGKDEKAHDLGVKAIGNRGKGMVREE
jgi:hypothetical protein